MSMTRSPSLARSSRSILDPRNLLAALLIAVASGCVPVAPTPARPAPAPERLPSPGGLLGNDVRPVDQRLLGGVQYDLPVEANSWVEAEVTYLSQRRDVVARWMERGDAYEAFVKQVFREHGIPTDLYHLALIESGFIPSARSRAGAVGVWQFMPATSGDVGLKIDTVLDERMDPVRSTRAAARHLRSLYRIHGDWALAAAAYNAGSTRINRSLSAHGATNFWDLAQRGDLAEETRQYVPRLYAMTIIGRDRQRFGFPPPNPGRSFAFDSIHVDYSVPLAELEQMVGLEPGRLTEMNPHLLRGMTPAAGYWVWVPQGRGVEMQRAYLASEMRRQQEQAPSRTIAVVETPRPAAAPARAPAAAPAPARAPAQAPAARPALATAGSAGAGGSTTHTVRAGETLSGIAQRYGVTVREIQQANSLSGSTIVTGSRLRIPAGGAAAEPEAPRFVEHTVVWGETLSGIAQQYGVSMAQVREANALSGSNIVTGSRLRIPAAGAAAPTAAAPARPAPAAPAAAPAARPAQHTVRAGETLSGIAQQYGVTVAQIQAANSLSSSTIGVGRQLTIPGAGAASASPAAPRAAAPAPAAQPARAAVEHTIQPGETLSGIAQRYGVTVAQIQEANSLSGSTIVTGRRLRIPAASAGTGSAPAPVAALAMVEHLVASGETLSGIAHRYGVTVAEIQESNALTGSVIVPGQRLRITVQGEGAGNGGAARGSEQPAEHTVASGDTLWGIAQRYGTTVEALQRVNGLGDRPIVPGQRLTVPR
jgi:membrane-bound lytic murein transglycosylase D